MFEEFLGICGGNGMYLEFLLAEDMNYIAQYSKSSHTLKFLSKSKSSFVRYILAGNKNISFEILESLLGDESYQVRTKARKHLRRKQERG